jgi:hypothetical protein
MKAFILAGAILAAVTTVAQADSSSRARDSMAQMPHQQRAHKSIKVANDVVVDGRVVGRDPSLHVRAAMANEYYSLSAAGAEGGGGDAGGGAAAE